MPLGDFGQTHQGGFDSLHKTVDRPQRFRQRSKQTPGVSAHGWKFTDPADPPKQKTGPRFASRLQDRGDVVSPGEPQRGDLPKPHKYCEPRPPTALVDDERIGGKPGDQSPRRAGHCHGRMGKKPIGSRPATANVFDPEKQPEGTGEVVIHARRKHGARVTATHSSLRVGEELPCDSPSSRRKPLGRRVGGPDRPNTLHMLHWEQ
eukprot:TRINITY_DN47571_c0_g1_i1.p1 TRINITY_DN47571_c0_g1~~TRINITY_DN47571_c0_g1_i1.p1  ORF type:complete len:233 (+),score=44.35 TRINITY_DN47571_c0_g1_i1:87-701(+)